MSKQFLTVTLLIVSIIVFPVSTEAVTGNTVGFSVKALLPDNQISHDKSYFDLAMQPGQEQTLEVQVYNSKNKPISIQAKLNTASTNINGLMDYIHETKPDESMKIVFSDIAKLRVENIDIPAGSSVQLQIDIKMPDQSFDGILLGGIMIKENTDSEDENAQGIQIRNQYAYVIGICLSETDVIVEPALHLNHIKPSLTNGYSSIAANLQNSEAIDIQNMNIQAQIYKHDSDDVLYSDEKTNVCMAPNSNFDFSIHCNNHKIESGTYRLHILATTEAKQWEWNEVFTIESDEANEINEEAVLLEDDNDLVTAILCYSLLLILLIAGFIAGFYLGRRGNSKR